MISSYNTKFAFQELEFIENTSMTKAEDFQKILSENQEITLQTQIEAADNVIASIITDFSDMIVSNFVDVLQKKIDEIAKRRRVALLQNTLRKTKIDETVEFCVFVMFDETLTLSIRSEFNAKLHREKLYRMMNPKKYSSENQQSLERFLRECVTTFQIKSLIYKENLIRVMYAQGFLFDRSAEK